MTSSPRNSRARILIALSALAMLASACGSTGEVQAVLQPGITTGAEPAAAAGSDTSQDVAANPTAAPAESSDQPAPAAVDDSPVEVAPAAAAQDEPAEDSAQDATASDAVNQRPVIASAEGTAKFPELRIHSLRRQGDLLQLNFTVTVQAPSDDDTYYVRKTFSSIEDSQLTGNAANSLEAASFSGITLIDSVNGNRHLVLRDTQGDCLCTSFPDFFINSEYPERFNAPGSALFPAPPQDVSSMTVLFPVFGSFEIEIENG